MSRYCFWQHLCVCAFVCTKSGKLLIRSWCNFEGICSMGNARNVSKLVTFDLDLGPWELYSYFSFAVYVSSTVKSFKCLNLATSFAVWRYIFGISRSPSSFKVIGVIPRSQQWKCSCVQVCAPLAHSLICFLVRDKKPWFYGYYFIVRFKCISSHLVTTGWH